MHLTTSTALAILALASQAVAEPQPYKADNAGKMMSIRDMFGVARRQSDGYTPSQSYCGLGETCAEACGAGYVTCSSTDDAIHCYDPTALQTCCPDGTGNSCDDGYYCTGTSSGETLCCPNGQTLAQCAAAYSVTGSLTRETAAPTTSSSTSSSAVATSSSFSSSVAASSSSAAANSTTSSAESKTTAHHGHSGGNSTVITLFGTSYTTTSCSTSTGAAATQANNFTTTKGGPSPTASQVATSAGGFIKPAGAAAAILAAVFTFLL